jgi:hypothetical protein
MKHGMQRHVAFVFNSDKDETKTYLDGSLLGTTTHLPGTLAKLDCNLNHETAYTGLGHLAPGTRGLKGSVQDWLVQSQRSQAIRAQAAQRSGSTPAAAAAPVTAAAWPPTEYKPVIPNGAVAL